MPRLFVTVLAASLALSSVALRAEDVNAELDASAEAQGIPAIVRGLAADDLLNVRATAAPTGIVLGRLPNGSAVWRRGCEKFNGYEWCRVESVDIRGLDGWTPGRYLKAEGDAPAAAPEPLDEVDTAVMAALPQVMDPPPLQSAPSAPETQPPVASDPVASEPAAIAEPVQPERDLTRTVLLAGLAVREGARADQILAFEGRHEIAATDAAGHALALAFAAQDAGAADIYTPADADAAAEPAETPVAEAADEIAAAPGIPLPTPRPDRGEAPPTMVAALADDRTTLPPAKVEPVPAAPPAELVAPQTMPPTPVAEAVDAGQPVPARTAEAPTPPRAPAETPATMAVDLTARLATGERVAALSRQPAPMSVSALPESRTAIVVPQRPADAPAAPRLPAPVPPLAATAPEAGPAIVVAQTQSVPPARGFDATAEIPCARYVGQPMTRCEAGAVRLADGSADVTIAWPDGGRRVIRFRNGEPEGTDSRGEFRFTREANLNMIRVGLSERFEITDSLPFGD